MAERKVHVLHHLTQTQLRQPFFLEPNRVKRTYRGGFLLEGFRRYPQPQDGWAPEDWLGSTTASRLQMHPNEGLSLVRVGDRELILGDIIKEHPQEMLGEKHVSKFGTHPFLLVKLLDSCERLRIQVHPSRQQALAIFGSQHGKAEAWYILETRSIDGVAPYILLGFQEGVSPQEFRDALLNQDTNRLVAMMHRVEVQPGDIFMVEAGVPHAIGSGIFMLEIQEPSDLTVYAEAAAPHASVDDPGNHLGLGWERALELFDYEGASYQQNLAGRLLKPQAIAGSAGVQEIVMGECAAPYFGMTKLVIRDRAEMKCGTYAIAVVAEGGGSLEAAGQRWAINAGDAMFCPAILGDIIIKADQKHAPLTILCCRPPSYY